MYTLYIHENQRLFFEIKEKKYFNILIIELYVIAKSFDITWCVFADAGLGVPC